MTENSPTVRTGHLAILYSFFCFTIAIVFTLIVKFVDVAQVGPKSSSVGLARLNSTVHSFIGLHPIFGRLSDIVLAFAFLSLLIFLILGAKDLLAKKSLKKIQKDFYLLLGFYFLVGIVYVIFEHLALNYRPILIDGTLEASFPSSHTLFAVCLFSMAFLNTNLITKNQDFQTTLKITALIMMILTIVFRFLSGVHWTTDILGGIIWGVALVSLYFASARDLCKKMLK